MIETIEGGKIDYVIVKDFSCLGRNQMETGYYVESYFPLHGIRLILVTAQVETTDGVSNLNKRNSINSCSLLGDVTFL